MWTHDKPTKPGKYWVALHPFVRGHYETRGYGNRAELTITGKAWVLANAEGTGCQMSPEQRIFDGALYCSRETPPDPFANKGE